MIGLEWAIGIFVIISLLIIWIIYYDKHLKVEIPTDSNLALNFCTDRTGGHAVGVEWHDRLKDGISTQSDRALWQFCTIDREYDGKGRLTAQKILEVPVSKNYRVVLPKGTWSMHRNIVIYLPENATDLSPNLRRTPFGMTIANIIETETKIDEYIREAIRQGARTNQEIATLLQQGELSQQLQQRTIEFAKTMMPTMIQERLSQPQQEQKK